MDELSPSVPDRWGRNPRLRALTRWIYEPVDRCWTRTTWFGLEHVPREGAALLVANRGAAPAAEAAVIVHGVERALHRPLYWLAPAPPVRSTAARVLWTRSGGVLAARPRVHELLHDAQQLALVVVDLHEPASWVVESALRAGVPVLPVAVSGAAVPSALGRIALFPVGLQVRVLAPLHLDAVANQPRYDPAVVAAHTDRLAAIVERALEIGEASDLDAPDPVEASGSERVAQPAATSC